MSDITTARIKEMLPDFVASEAVTGGLWLTIAETIVVERPVPLGFGATCY